VPPIRQNIVKMRNSGLTLNEIGLKLGVSAERVRQIIAGKPIKKDQASKIDIPLSTGDVARLLNIHTNTVRRWSRNGVLKSYRIGPRGDRRFRRSDVQKLFQKSA
jgi:excisionase family DNA binding protein